MTIHRDLTDSSACQQAARFDETQRRLLSSSARFLPEAAGDGLSKLFNILLLLFAGGLLTPSRAGAQDFPDVQAMANRVLFAGQENAARQREAEARRVEQLDQTTQRQAVLLQAQADSVRQLAGELQNIRDERRLTDLAQEFDASIAAHRWAVTRSLIGDAILVDLEARSDSVGQRMSADEFIAFLPASAARAGVLPRSNPRVSIEGERAIVTSDGFAWGSANHRTDLDRQSGQYEYRFARSEAGWKLDALVFRRSPGM